MFRSDTTAFLGMNGQVQSSRERLGGLATGTTGWFSGLIAADNVQIAENDNDVDSKVKTKLLSMWNNVKYGWTVKMKTNFSKESPVYLLGRCYHKKDLPFTDPAEEADDLDKETSGTGSEVSLAIDATTIDEGIEGFKRDFVSRLWLTYRREFPILNGSNFTTDCGWGCMLRSGQMMLAQALVCHFLGRDWRWQPDEVPETSEQKEKEEKHRMIIKWFGDQPKHSHSPLSIHALVSLGASTGKRAGDWYGPASVAHLLNQAVKEAALTHPEFNDLAVYVAQDCAVYLDDVRKVCEFDNGKWKSLILLVPLRLGADKLNPSYTSCLTELFTLDACIGVIGGRPRHSLYFIGFQEDKLIHLDPHYCQETVDVLKENFPLTTFHCTSPRKMLVSKMDPSCCIGFYVRDEKSFKKLVKAKSENQTSYPMFLFCEGSGEDLCRDIEVGENPLPFAGNETEDDHYECEEFELI